MTVKKMMEKVEMIPFSTCWWWVGGVSSTGYGTYRFKGKVRKAHRVISYLVNKTDLDGGKDSFICHRCNNPLCVRPEHLYQGSRSDNERDKASDGAIRNPSGKQKLTVADIPVIRERLKTETWVSVAASYGVHKTTIGKVATGKNWGWV